MTRMTDEDRAQALAAKRLEKTVKRLITMVGATMLAFFTFLELKNVPIDKITEVFDVYSIEKIGLFIFFVGWLAGATDDTEIQKEALVKDKDKARFKPLEYGGIVAFFLLFALLFYFRESLVLFQGVLLAFIILNVGTYRIVLNRVDQMARESEAVFLDPRDKDYFSYMKLYCLLGYLRGSWQAKRFKVLIVLAFLQLLVAIMTYTDAYARLLPDRPLGGASLYVYIEYLPSILFLVYVLISEAWMKIYRYKIRSDYVTIDLMREHFGIQKKQNAKLPPLDLSGIFAEKLDDNPNYVSASLLELLKFW